MAVSISLSPKEKGWGEVAVGRLRPFPYTWHQI